MHEYVVLQQPENLEGAENFAKLKQSVLSDSEKQPALNVKKVSAQIVEELSKTVGLKDKMVNASDQQGSNTVFIRLSAQPRIRGVLSIETSPKTKFS